MLKSPEKDREYLNTTQAAEHSGLSKNYIATLLRRSTLDGFQLGRDRFVYIDSLENFLKSTRKPGPKGPREKTQKPHHHQPTPAPQ
jgi:hypothetical protein